MLDVGRVEFHLRLRMEGVDARGHGDSQRTGAAAQIDDNRAAAALVDRQVDEKLGASSRHEDARVNGDAQPVELRPAHDRLQGQAVDPALHHVCQLGGRARLGHEHPCLFLGEDAAGGSQGEHDGCLS